MSSLTSPPDTCHPLSAFIGLFIPSLPPTAMFGLRTLFLPGGEGDLHSSYQDIKLHLHPIADPVYTS